MDTFLLYTVTDWYLCHMLPVETLGTLWIQFKYQKGQSRDNYIILLFNLKYKRQWINVIFQQDKHNIN